MQKFIAGALILQSVLLISCARSTSDTQTAEIATSTTVRREWPYVYCNVYMQDACFGIGVADRLEMHISVDSTFYQVTTSSGMRAQIYYGASPALPKSVKGEVRWRFVSGDFRRFDVQDASGVLESNYIFRPVHSKVGNFVHVKLYASTKDSGIADSFIQNFRECRPSGSGLECSEEMLFASGASSN